ncbi:MAG: efflux RND transporter periplasmic adaptor subunit [Rhizobium sp.]|nr:efflux RND transporter periplasmic adaptor subunit [Rhizobium sp.]
MPRLPTLLPLALALALAAAPVAATPLPITPAQSEAMGLAFARAEPADWIPVATIPAQAELAPGARTLLPARHAGTVERVLVADGDTVAAGQPLLALSSADWSATLAAATGRAARLDALARQATRSEALLAAGVIARREDEATRAELSALRSESRADAPALQSASVAADGGLVLRATVAGTVLRRHVSAGSPFQPGDVLVEIASGEGLVAEGQAPARLAGQLAPGMRASTPDGAIGEVVGVGGAIDPMTRSLPVLANLPAGAAVPGALIELGISRRASAGVAQVPATAVIAVAGQSSVFVRRGEGLEVVPVQVHFRDSQQAWISGLAPKSEVVSRGVLALKAVAESSSDATGEG